jgi:hypothetical protein
MCVPQPDGLGTSKGLRGSEDPIVALHVQLLPTTVIAIERSQQIPSAPQPATLRGLTPPRSPFQASARLPAVFDPNSEPAARRA